MDRIRKANRASQLNDGDSERDAESEIAWKDTEISGVKVSGQLIKRCTTERGTWQLRQQGRSEHVMRCTCVSWV